MICRGRVDDRWLAGLLAGRWRGGRARACWYQRLCVCGNESRNASPVSGMSGRPLRMRADHWWPHSGQSYHAITHVLSAVGATHCPQSGQFIDAVAESGLDMPKQRSTTMPRRYGTLPRASSRIADRPRESTRPGEKSRAIASALEREVHAGAARSRHLRSAIVECRVLMESLVDDAPVQLRGCHQRDVVVKA